MSKVAVLDDFQNVARSLADWNSLPAGTDVDFFHDHEGDEDALVDRLEPYDILVVMRERTPLRRSLLARLTRLRLVVTTGLRNASIDLDAAREHGIVVCGTPGSAAATTELAWALILALARHVPAEDTAVRAGRWQHTLGTDLAGASLGLLGFGRLGRAMVPVAQAFGMNVLAWSQHLTPDAAVDGGATYVAKEELFGRSDVVSVHLVLSDRTRGLIGTSELAAMQPSAFLVNTSRGPIVDEDALVGALHVGQIAGAGLDVYADEPLPAGHPILAAPNTVLTPHIGFVTRNTYTAWYPACVEAVAAFLAGEPIYVLNAAAADDG